MNKDLNNKDDCFIFAVFKVSLGYADLIWFIFYDLFSIMSSSCCVGVEPEEQSEAFYQLFLPSAMDGLLSLASQLMSQAEVCHSSFKNKSNN